MTRKQASVKVESATQDPFSEAERQALHNRLQHEFGMRTHAIVREIDDDIRSRGIGEQATHRRIRELFEAIDAIAGAVLKFDVDSADLRLRRAKALGETASNPFTLKRENGLLELVRHKVISAALALGDSHRLRIGKMIRGASPESLEKIMTDNQSTLGGTAQGARLSEPRTHSPLAGVAHPGRQFHRQGNAVAPQDASEA
jgi:hypothetical protein